MTLENYKIIKNILNSLKLSFLDFKEGELEGHFKIISSLIRNNENIYLKIPKQNTFFLQIYFTPSEENDNLRDLILNYLNQNYPDIYSTGGQEGTRYTTIYLSKKKGIKICDDVETEIEEIIKTQVNIINTFFINR